MNLSFTFHFLWIQDLTPIWTVLLVKQLGQDWLQLDLLPPPHCHRRHFDDAAAAADRMSASRRRRFHDVFTSCCTSYMLLDFCNAIYNEALTLTKSSKNNAGVFLHSVSEWVEFNAPLDTIQVISEVEKPLILKWNTAASKQSVFVDNFVKMKADKSFAWNFFGNLVNKTDGTVKDFNSVYCNNCL